MALFLASGLRLRRGLGRLVTTEESLQPADEAAGLLLGGGTWRLVGLMCPRFDPPLIAAIALAALAAFTPIAFVPIARVPAIPWFEGASFARTT